MLCSSLAHALLCIFACIVEQNQRRRVAVVCEELLVGERYTS